MKYNKKMNKETKITLDGLARYAVINMFHEGVNRYVNSKIRGVHIYDDLYLSKVTNKGLG